MRHSITLKDFYKDYKKERKDWGTMLDNKKYKAVINDFFTELKDLIIKEHFKFKMPYRLGYISVRRAEINHNNLKVDFKKSKELNKTVYHLNMHSDNCYFFLYWDKYNSYTKFTNASYYRFKPVRGFKRQLSSYIQKCNSDPFSKNYSALRPK